MSPAEVKDLYKILGVGETATKEDIKKAFRKLAVKYHPDKLKGDKKSEERFKEINEAYQILSDDKKRQQYDFMRKNPFGAGFSQGPGGFSGDQSFQFNMDDLGNLFSGFGGLGDMFDLFGSKSKKSRRAASASMRGADAQTSITIPFETAAQGGQHAIRIPKKGVCPQCGGTGAQPGSRQITCPRCKGTGSVFVSQGSFGFSRTCPECMGTGTKITQPCSVCHGTGKTEASKTITVKIPAGIRDGQKIRLAGEGEPSPGSGPNGDLYILVNVLAHPKFKRDGDILYSEADIDLVTAIQGGKVVVDTLQGPVTLKIPAGTQPGTKFKLKGCGVKSKKGRMGDHFVTVRVALPRNLSAKQRKLFDEFASSLK
ncbi:molecular chaperone DnaJ [Candidatus Sumerlaeota bacterium]|nr:molecular chaperone DnaJ [Candidatus Sumerlaeota bacterium]